MSSKLARTTDPKASSSGCTPWDKTPRCSTPHVLWWFLVGGGPPSPDVPWLPVRWKTLVKTMVSTIDFPQSNPFLMVHGELNILNDVASRMGTSSSMRIIYDLGSTNGGISSPDACWSSAVPLADSHFGWDFALVNQSGFRDPWGMVHQLARMTLGISTSGCD